MLELLVEYIQFGCVIKLKKNKTIGIPKTIFYSIGSFIMILDFIFSIVMKFSVRKKEKIVKLNTIIIK